MFGLKSKPTNSTITVRCGVGSISFSKGTNDALMADQCRQKWGNGELRRYGYSSDSNTWITDAERLRQEQQREQSRERYFAKPWEERCKHIIQFEQISDLTNHDLARLIFACTQGIIEAIERKD